MSDDVMTLIFTNAECRKIVDAIDQSRTRDLDVLSLRNAMLSNAYGAARFPFMAYVNVSDDEIVPGFKLSEHGRRVTKLGDE